MADDATRSLADGLLALLDVGAEPVSADEAISRAASLSTTSPSRGRTLPRSVAPIERTAASPNPGDLHRRRVIRSLVAGFAILVVVAGVVVAVTRGSSPPAGHPSSTDHHPDNGPPPRLRSVVPDVLGLSPAKAEGVLKAHGFANIRVSRVPVPAAANVVKFGVVWTESPRPGTIHPVRARVAIAVSVPSPTIIVPPNVIGLTPHEAAHVLIHRGFTMATPPVSAREVLSATVPVGDVAATVPPVGTAQQFGTAVRLVLSAGPPAIAPVVPSVSGETYAVASQQLASTGLIAQEASVRVCHKNEAGLVSSTSPASGSSVPERTIVIVYVGSYDPTAPSCHTP
jgi:beta-lactam-binding protein with PASTA domain